MKIKYLACMLPVLLLVVWTLSARETAASELETTPAAIAASIPTISLPARCSANSIRLPFVAAEVACDEETECSVIASNKLKLESGNLFLNTSSSIIVECAGYSILLPKHTIALLVKTPTCLKVEDISGHHSEPVRICIRNRFLDLESGQEVALANDTQSIRNEIARDSIARRMMHIYELPNNSSLFCSEYQIVSLMKHNAVLANVIKTDPIMAKHLLKLAASVAVVTAAHGPYVNVTE